MRSGYSFKISRKNVRQLFVMYSCALFYAVFLTPNRYRGDEKVEVNLIPVVGNIERFYGQGNEHFWTYYIGYWGNIFGNIILLMPFGFLLKCLLPKKSSLRVCLYGLLLSASIELIQLVLRIGVCDVDDVILNVIGVVAGIGLYGIIRKTKPRLFAGFE